jgi:hypothetical protein
VDAFLDGALQGFWSGGQSGPTLTYIGTTELTSDSDTYTFTNHDIGQPAADRLVIVVATEDATDANPAFTSITIGGVAATKHVEQDEGGSSGTNVAIASRLVAAGTTATIVLNTANPGSHASISVYTLTGYQSATPVDTGGTSSSGSGAGSVALTTLPGDAIVAGVINTSLANPTYTWAAPMSKDADISFSAEGGSASSAHGTATSSSTSVSVTPSVSATRAMAAVAWR